MKCLYCNIDLLEKEIMDKFCIRKDTSCKKCLEIHNENLGIERLKEK